MTSRSKERHALVRAHTSKVNPNAQSRHSVKADFSRSCKCGKRARIVGKVCCFLPIFLCYSNAIQIAIPIIIRFSVNEMNPSGTLLSAPTHAHLISRLSM